MKHSLLFVTLCLTACGGGGGDGDTKPSPPPPPPPSKPTPYGTMFDGEMHAPYTGWTSTCDMTGLKMACMSLSWGIHEPGIRSGDQNDNATWYEPYKGHLNPNTDTSVGIAFNPVLYSWTLVLTQTMSVGYTDGTGATYSRQLTYTVVPAPVSNG